MIGWETRETVACRATFWPKLKTTLMGSFEREHRRISIKDPKKVYHMENQIKKQLEKKDWEILINSLPQDKFKSIAEELRKYCYRQCTGIELNNEKIKIPLLTIGELIDYLGELKGTYVQVIPSSWWQMLKKQYFPQWLENILPVQFDFQTCDVPLISADICCDQLWAMIYKPILETK